MAQVVYSHESIEDLGWLVEFLMEAAPASVSSAVEAIFEAIGVLERHPLLGRRGEGETRELVVSRGTTGYVALYRFYPAADTVRVLRIRHQREAGYVD